VPAFGWAPVKIANLIHIKLCYDIEFVGVLLKLAGARIFSFLIIAGFKNEITNTRQCKTGKLPLHKLILSLFQIMCYSNGTLGFLADIEILF